MSMSAWEQQALDSIKDGLASSDPTLAARMTMFTRLASGEEMPAREKIQVGSRRAILRSHAGSRRVDQRLGLQGGMLLLLWFVTTVALVTVALASNRGSQDACAGSWATFCSGGAPASGSTSAPVL